MVDHGGPEGPGGPQGPGERSAVVSGASIAGLSAAFWLRRAGWDVTVLEQADGFRDGGQNVDVRGVAREVLSRMGLFDAVKARNTTETGTVVVDGRGEVRVELPSEGADGATAELEVLRGDLARVLLEALPDDLPVRYGDTIARVAQERNADGEHGVSLTTAGGRRLHADLLVVAEGVASTTRDLVFGDAVRRRPLGVNMAFGTIARRAEDDDRWRWYNAVGGRQIHLRPDPYGTIRAILASADDHDLTRLDHDAALAALAERYEGAGWVTERVLEGFADADDLYVDHLTRIEMDTWHRGRVVLAGDAGWCVTPLGGGGASLALTSGYVLAAVLAQHPGDLPAALAAYEGWMRPLVDDVPTVPRAMLRVAFPRTRLGLAVRGLGERLVAVPPLRGLVARLTEVAGTERPLPELVERA